MKRGLRFLVFACVRLSAQPAADHHPHFLRSAVAPPEGLALTAKDLISQMDEARIRRAAVFSIAYQFGNPNRPPVDYAVAEIARCAKDPGLRVGLKLHFGNSDVDMENAAHVAQLQSAFRKANGHRMAIMVHIRSTVNRKRPWGAQQATPAQSRTGAGFVRIR